MKILSKVLTIASAILSLAIPSIATDTAFNHSFRSMTGGLNTTSAPIYLKDSQSPVMLNVDEDATYGALKTRKGSLTCGTYPTGNPILNTWQYVIASGSKYIIATDGTSVYATPDCTSWTAIATGLPKGDYDFATVNNKLWVVSQSTSVFTWDTANTVYLDSSNDYAHYPHAKHITYWQSRVWLSNTSDNPSSLYFSILVDTSGVQLDPTLAGSFSNLAQFYINKADGGQINVTIPYAGYLYTLKDTGIWRIQFQDEYNNALVKVSEVGCISGRTAREFNGVLYFLGKDGLEYSFNGSQVSPVALSVKSLTQAAAQPMGGLASQSYNTDTMFGAGTVTGDAIHAGDNELELFSSTVPATHAIWPGGYYTSDAPSYVTNITTYTAGMSGDACTSLSTVTINTSYLDYAPTPNLKLVNLSTGCYSGSATMTIPAYNNPLFGHATMMIAPSTGYANLDIQDKTTIGTTHSMCVTFATYRTACITSNNIERAGSSRSMVTSIQATLSGTGGGTQYLVFNTSTGTIYYTDIKITRNNTVEFYAYSDADMQVMVSSAGWSMTNSETLKVTYAYSGYINNGVYNKSLSAMYIPFGYMGSPAHHITTWESSPFYATQLSGWKSQVLSSSNTYAVDTSTIAVYVRYGSSIADLSTKTYYPYVNTTSMSVSTANLYGQLKVYMADTAIDPNSRVHMDNATISWQYGNLGTIAPTSFVYDNKLWLSISTANTSGYNDTMLKLSLVPEPHWSLYDLKCDSLLVFGLNPYCTSAQSSSVKRFDTGNTDDGSAINFEWQSGDQLESAPYYPKYLQYMWLDYLASTGGSFLFGYSTDQGATWTDLTETSSGSETREIHRYNINPPNAPQYRVHVKGSTTVPLSIYGLQIQGYTRDIYEE